MNSPTICLTILFQCLFHYRISVHPIEIFFLPCLVLFILQLERIKTKELPELETKLEIELKSLQTARDQSDEVSAVHLFFEVRVI